MTDAFINDVMQDLNFIVVGIFIMLVYACVIIGSCSPIHSRVVVAFVGLGTIALSYFGGFGICGVAGIQTSYMHNILPFIVLCVGVDDMFVICNALDQTDINKTVE